MPRTTMGRGGPEVSRIGVGTAALGRPGYINLEHGQDMPGRRTVADLQANTWAVLDAAHAAGVTYLDTARSYGRAEAFVAGWLGGHDPGCVVGSKWGYTYTAGWKVDAEVHEVKDHSLATFERQWHESRSVMGDRLALYQIHSATLDSGVLEDRAVLDRLAGLDVIAGLTLSGPDQATSLRRALEVGEEIFGCVQATWNPLEPSVGPALAEAHQAGWGVIVKEAVANGRLTPRGQAPQAMAEVADAAGVGVDAVALAAALAQPFVDVVLSGAATVAQLESNLRALEVDPARVTDLDVAEEPEAYWARRGALPWT